MNWYFYWYFTIYSIYKRFSWDKHFDIFATSMFSFIVASLIIGISSYMFGFLCKTNFLFSSSIPTIVIFAFIFIANYGLFLPKRRQLRQLNKYKNNQSTTKDVLSIVFSLFSVGVYLSVILLGKNYFEG